MSLAMLEERCKRFMDLMGQASVAIDQQDAIILEAVSRSTEVLLEQIERSWYLAMAGPERTLDDEDLETWERLRLFMQRAMHQSAENQRKMYSWARRGRPVPSTAYPDALLTLRYMSIGRQDSDSIDATVSAQAQDAFPES